MKRVYAISRLVIIVLLNLLLISCDTTDPNNYNNYHNKILFTSSRSGKPQLYMMNPNGLGIRQLTFGNYWHSDGRWSPDAKQIVCNTEEGTTTAGLQMVVMNVDGSNRKLLGYGNQMSWHPEGKKIVFSFMPSAEIGDLSSYIYVVNLADTERYRITNNDGVLDESPSYSTDGLTIVFTSDRDYLIGQFRSELYLMNFDGTNQKRLTYTNNSINGNPSFSHDNNLIVFNSNGIITSVKNDGTELTQITQEIEKRNLIFVQPKWSPDDNQIVFIGRATDGSEKSFLYMVNKDGTNLHRVIDDDSVTSCDWSK